MNVRLLRRIAKVIQEKPTEFDMVNFTGYTNCGTTHCIGGWAQEFTGKHPMEALRITPEQGNRLFYVTNNNREPLWPKRFMGRKKKNLSMEDSWWKPTPRQAVARIEHFIKTQGKE